jgi:hypothetical protein
MYVGIGLIVPDPFNVNKDHWADNSVNIAHAIQFRIGNFRTLVDGVDMSTANTIPLGGSEGIVLVAKDKSTLLTGLKTVKGLARIGGEGENLGFVTGSYDREKAGAWIKTKFQAKKSTGDFNALDRNRLDARAYYVIVARATTLLNNHKSVNLHQSELQLNALPGLISGKLTKEEAVDNLFRDLLVA